MPNILDIACAAIFAGTDAAGYGRSAYNSGSDYDFPKGLNLALIIIFGIILIIAITKRYAKRNLSARRLYCCSGKKDESKALLTDLDSSYNTTPLSAAITTTKSTTIGLLDTDVNNNPSKCGNITVGIARGITAAGKAIIASSSFFRNALMWTRKLPAAARYTISGVLTFPAAIALTIAQFSMLQDPIQNPDSRISRVIRQICKYKYTPDRWIARVANTAKTVMYFDTLRKVLLTVGALEEDYSPSWIIALIGAGSGLLFIAGNAAFEKGINAITGHPTNSLESKIMDIPLLKYPTGIIATTLKSATGVLAITNEINNETLAIITGAVLAIPNAMTMFGYYMGDESTTDHVNADEDENQDAKFTTNV